MNWMILPLKRYADFQGRSRRSEFWMWVLFVLIASVALSLLDQALGLGGRSQFGRLGSASPTTTGFGYGAGIYGGVLTGIFALAILIPNLAVQVRRLHDTGRSGWWLLLMIVPYLIGIAVVVASAMSGNFGAAAAGGLIMLLAFVGAIVLFVFFCLEGTQGPNRFGSDPKNPETDLTSVFR